MADTASELANAVGLGLATELSQAASRIEHCLGQLTDEQVWQRPRADMNAIGNLVLHLTGNLKQMIVAALLETPDTRQRQAEFDERRVIPKAEVISGMRAAVAEAFAAITTRDAGEWLRERPVRGESVNGLRTAIRSVAHFRGHTQEIIHLTREILGEQYHYAGQPPGKSS